MLNEVVTEIRRRHLLQQLFHDCLNRDHLIRTKIVACFKIEGNCAVWVLLQVALEKFFRNVVEFLLVQAQCLVDV